MVHQMNGAAGLCGLAAMQQAANQLETALLQASEKDEYPECSALLNVLAQAVEGLLVAGPGVLQSLTPAP
jgi:HPt (histidine-containing phosphotransfer) domain-containing protein